MKDINTFITEAVGKGAGQSQFEYALRCLLFGVKNEQQLEIDNKYDISNIKSKDEMIDCFIKAIENCIEYMKKFNEDDLFMFYRGIKPLEELLEEFKKLK